MAIAQVVSTNPSIIISTHISGNGIKLSASNGYSGVVNVSLIVYGD